MEYRRGLSTKTWHFCRNCPDWPSEPNLVISTEPLTDAQVCSECLALAQRGQCKKYESADQIARNGADGSLAD